MRWNRASPKGMGLGFLRSFDHGTGDTIVLFPFIDHRTQRLERLFDAAGLTDSVVCGTDGNAPLLRHSNHARHTPPEDGHQGEQYAWAHFPHLGSPDLGRKYSLSVTAASYVLLKPSIPRRSCVIRGITMLLLYSAVLLAVLAANAVAILLAATIAYRRKHHD